MMDINALAKIIYDQKMRNTYPHMKIENIPSYDEVPAVTDVVYRETARAVIAAFELASKETELVMLEAKKAIEKSIATIITAAFVIDQADGDYKRGYLEALKTTAIETMQPLADVLPKLNKLVVAKQVAT